MYDYKKSYKKLDCFKSTNLDRMDSSSNGNDYVGKGSI